MKFSPALTPATLIRRYKRFLADVSLADGETITVHCPNTGAMTGCDLPGSPVWLSHSNNPRRKYAYGLEQVLTPAGLVGVNTARANALINEALAQGALSQLRGYSRQKAEATLAVGGSRLDFLLSEHVRGAADCYLEVKSVTLHGGSGQGLFPDTVSLRARKHLEALQQLIAEGYRAVLLFCVQHAGVDRVSPAEEIDPAYAAALRAAVQQGVEVLAYGAQMSPTGTQIEQPLPVWLSPQPEKDRSSC